MSDERAMRFCTECGVRIPARPFCIQCGATLAPLSQSQSSPDRVATPSEDDAPVEARPPEPPAEVSYDYLFKAPTPPPQNVLQTVSEPTASFASPDPFVVEPPPPQQPHAPRNGGGGGRVLVVVLALLLLLGGAAGAWLLRSDDSDPIAQDDLTGQSSTPNPDVTNSTSAPTASNETSKPPAPEPDAQCWDGSRVVRAKRACPTPNTVAALKWAFPVDWSSCVAGPDAAYNQWSHWCLLRGVRVHIAAYRSTAARDLRLSVYGTCTPDGEGRQVCEASSSTDRYVRTYEGKILFYMSANSADYDVMMALPQRSAEDIVAGLRS